MKTFLIIAPFCLLILGQVSNAAHIRNNSVQTTGESLQENESVSADDEESEDDHDEDLRRQELEYFLSQFVLIKTPYGYIVARITPSGQMVRLRRNGQQIGNFLESSIDDESYPSKHHLRVRRNGQTSQVNFELGSSNQVNNQNGRSILQDIRERRRAASNFSNSNFQLRVRKSHERNTRGSVGKNFQLRV